MVKDTVTEARQKIPGFKEAEQKNYQCCEQPHYNSCFWGLTVPLVNNFSKGALIKFLLELAIKRNLKKIYKHSKSEILRFGLTIGVTAMAFHAVLCLLRRLGKSKGFKFAYNISRKVAMIIAAVISSVPLLYGL